MKTLDIAVIGCGQAGRGHVKSCQRNPNVGGVAGAEVIPQNAEITRQECGIEVLEDYRALLTRPEIDAVIIAASNRMHPPMALDALRAGKHVLCEKPMALNEPDAREMVRVAREQQRILHVGFELRNSVLPLRVADILKSGEIGTSVSFQVIHYRGAFCPQWKGKRTDGGSMFLMETCHVIDLFRFWSGDEVESVVSIGAPKVVPYYEFHDTDFSTFIFRSGLVGHVVTCHTRSGNPEVWTDEVGYSEPYGHQYEYTVTGTESALRFLPLKGILYVLQHSQNDNGYFSGKLKRAEDFSHLRLHTLIHDTATEVNNFIDAIREGRDTNITPEDALNTHLVCYAGQESQDSGERVRIQC